jgi:ATP-dependent Clp protease ATP-binding subunit ClpA
MFERFTDRARGVVITARTAAVERGDDQIRLVHMLYGLAVSDGLAARALTALGVDAAAVERELGRAGSAGGAPGSESSPGEADGGDAEALAAIGIDLDEIKRRIEESFGPGALERVPLTPKDPPNRTGGRLTFDHQARLTLALSIKEARALHHNYVGTEHVLLGLLRVAERHPRAESAAAIIRDLGLDPATAHDRAQTEVLQILRAKPPGW